MKQNYKSTTFEDALSRLKVLDSLIFSAYRELNNLYKNEKYTEWKKLLSERRKLYSTIDLIENRITEDLVKTGKWEQETAQYACRLKLCQVYTAAEKLKDIPELYQLHLGKIDTNEREYIVSRFMIDELTIKIEPYEKTVNELLKKMERLEIALDYLAQQRSFPLFGFNVETLRRPAKIKLAMERLKRYSSTKAYIAQILIEIREMRVLKESQYELHSYIMNDMPKPPSSDGIPDPTGDALTKIIDIYEARLNNQRILLANAQKIVDWVESALLFLDDDEKKIIEFYYFKKYSWAKIVTTVNYSERNCHYKHDSAIEKIIINL